jgi:hypothetical protein
MVDYLCVLFVTDGIKTSASTYHSTACRAGMETNTVERWGS